MNTHSIGWRARQWLMKKKRPMGLFGSRALVGLDLGSHTLKVAEVVRSDGGFKVRRVGMVQTPPGAVSKGVAANPEALAPAISKLLQKAGIRSKQVVTALGGEAVVIRKVTVPEMPQAELEEAITLEAEQYLPEGAGEVRRHYWVMGRVPGDGQLEVFLVVAGKEVIDRHLAPLAMAGIASPVMEVTPFSMVRAVAPKSPGDKATVYVDLGAESSDILILDKEGLRLARNIRIGGTTLTKAIAETLNLDVVAAMRLKEQRAQVLLDGTLLEDAVLGQLHQAILPVITSIATELRRSLDFYEARLGSQSVPKVVLTGGTAKLKNLAPFLSGKLHVPVEIGNPFGTCKPDAGFSPEYVADVAPMMAVALGLALRGAQA